MPKKKKEKKEYNLSFRRFEFKYVIPKFLIGRITSHLNMYMVPDKYAQFTPDGSYEVNSVYFDSFDLKNYYEKSYGLPFRKKQRVRFYDSKNPKADSPIFFEIKRKSSDIVTKDRIVGEFKDMSLLTDIKALHKKYGDSFNEFYQDVQVGNMKPVVLISYKRKAFFSKFSSTFRLTFDYDIAYAPVHDKFTKDVISKRRSRYTNYAILEAKFNGTMPYWFKEIIDQNDLYKTAFSKYGHSMQQCYNLFD